MMARRWAKEEMRVAVLVFAIAAGACTSRLPDAAKEHTKRGDAAFVDGQYRRALTAYAHARELAPTSPEVQRRLMRARGYWVAESAANLDLDEVDDVLYELSFLLDTDSANAVIYRTALANVLWRQGDGERAEAKLAEAIESDPSSPIPRLALGLMLMQREENAVLAKAELERVLKIRPEDFRALVALGELLLASGDVALASERLEAALRYGDSFDLRMALGRVRAREGNAKDAANHFLRATEQNPRSAEAWGALGEARLNSGRAEEAEEALLVSISIRPDVSNRTALGFSRLKQGRPASALDAFRDVLTIVPASAPALYGAGMANEALGRHEEAIEQYERLIALPAEELKHQAVADLRRDAQSRLVRLRQPPSPDRRARR